MGRRNRTGRGPDESEPMSHEHPIRHDTPNRDFASRHIGPSPEEVAEMLDVVGAKSLERLVAETMPEAIRQRAPLAIGPGLSEVEALAQLRAIAGGNQVHTSLIGQGYHGTLTPLVILRNVLENPAWYT